jgi:hypothetical protein
MAPFYDRDDIKHSITFLSAVVIWLAINLFELKIHVYGSLLQSHGPFCDHDNIIHSIAFLSTVVIWLAINLFELKIHVKLGHIPFCSSDMGS